MAQPSGLHIDQISLVDHVYFRLLCLYVYISVKARENMLQCHKLSAFPIKCENVYDDI